VWSKKISKKISWRDYTQMSNRYFITGGFWLPSVGCWLRAAFGAVPLYGWCVVWVAVAAGCAWCA
jgi:hypothetical protein